MQESHGCVLSVKDGPILVNPGLSTLGSVVGARSSELGRVGASWSVVGAGSSVVGASWSELGRFGVSSRRELMGPVIVGKEVGEAVGAIPGAFWFAAPNIGSHGVSVPFALSPAALVVPDGHAAHV